MPGFNVESEANWVDHFTHYLKAESEEESQPSPGQSTRTNFESAPKLPWMKSWC